jgi:hypothetical protein
MLQPFVVFLLPLPEILDTTCWSISPPNSGPRLLSESLAQLSS